LDTAGEQPAAIDAAEIGHEIRDDTWERARQQAEEARTVRLPPLVTVLMPVRNEASWIARSLGAVLCQDYPADRLEVLVIDGESDDQTRQAIRSLAGAERVRVLANPVRLQAAGLNIGLRQAHGEIIIRVDGHTLIAPDYVRICVATLQATGAANVGGRMDPVGVTATGQAIALATTSRFGVPAAFHTSSRAQETDTVYMGAWPRELLERLEGFDERLCANEDYELNYRIRRAGGRIVLSPALRSAYYCRHTFKALARQYVGYGRGKARMLRYHPRSLRPRQLVAPAFVAALILGPLCTRVRAARALWLALLAAYTTLNLAASARLTLRPDARAPWSVAWRVPLVFPTLHVAWGLGFWAELLAAIRGAARRRVSMRVRDADMQPDATVSADRTPATHRARDTAQDAADARGR
jgi:glycosyltransferase involved in cell wall biosynthesis